MFTIRLLVIVTLTLAATSSAFSQKAKPTPTPVETGYVNCQWRLFGFYLDMPEPDALKRVPLMQIADEGYEYSYTAQVTFVVSSSKYPQVDSITLRFRHGRVLDIAARLGDSFTNLHADQLAGWVMKQYPILPNEWETPSTPKDEAVNGIVRGARHLDFRGASFYVSNTNESAYFSLSYR